MRPLVTLDLDHTLWDPDDALHRAEKLSYDWLVHAVPAFGAGFTPEAFVAWRVQLREQQPALQHRVSQLRHVAFLSALESVGLEPARAASLAKKAFYVFWCERQNVRVFDATPALLKQLAQDYTLGALSNGNACLKQIGLASHFAFHFAAEDFPAAKPAPDLFIAALHQAGAVAADSVHIGDHPIDDIRGAHDVGMKTVWVNFKRVRWPSELPVPDAEIQHLADLPSAIARLLSTSSSGQQG
jgi:HAD superfamily hydrolase (TIGR01509 family)